MLPIRMTDKRRAWLVQLRDYGPAKRGRTKTGYDCMHAGWTEWDYRLLDGTPTTSEAAREQFGHEWWNYVLHNWEERITESGLAALDGAANQIAPLAGPNYECLPCRNTKAPHVSAGTLCDHRR